MGSCAVLSKIHYPGRKKREGAAEKRGDTADAAREKRHMPTGEAAAQQQQQLLRVGDVVERDIDGIWFPAKVIVVMLREIRFVVGFFLFRTSAASLFYRSWRSEPTDIHGGRVLRCTEVGMRCFQPRLLSRSACPAEKSAERCTLSHHHPAYL